MAVFERPLAICHRDTSTSVGRARGEERRGGANKKRKQSHPKFKDSDQQEERRPRTAFMRMNASFQPNCNKKGWTKTMLKGTNEQAKLLEDRFSR